VHPTAIELLQWLDFPTADLRSKSWQEFTKPGISSLDFIFTVCALPSSDVSIISRRQPIIGNWSFPDPTAVIGTDVEKHAAFAEVFRHIKNQVRRFCNLPVERLGRPQLQREITRMNRAAPA
jgi:arsenate reductase (thioredoxin)